MAFGSKAVQSIDDDEDEQSDSSEPDSKDSKKPSGPPAAQPKPRSASDSSLFSTAGKTAQEEGKAGLGPEGSDPSIIGMQGLTLVQRGIQMLSLGFPDNPGLTAVLADLTGRLQSIIPQLVSGASNGAGGMGLFGANMGGPMQPGQPPMGGAPPMGGMPPGGMPPPGMPPGGGPPMPPPNMPPIPPQR